MVGYLLQRIKEAQLFWPFAILRTKIGEHHSRVIVVDGPAVTHTFWFLSAYDVYI